MGKRKHRDKAPDELWRKIRRMERRDHRRRKNRGRYYSDNHYESENSSQTPDSYYSSDEASLEQEYHSESDNSKIRSTVSVPEPVNTADLGIPVTDLVTPPVTNNPGQSGTNSLNPPNTSALGSAASGGTTDLPALAPDILEVLGESKEKDEIFGPKIQEEISKRWGKIIMEGLGKDQKQKLFDSTLIPENFQLLKAPKLNPEISVVLSESTRNRDKRLEKAQTHLGVGIASVTNLMSSLIEGVNMDTKEIIKRLSETGQILLDLHFQNTVARRKLITYSLDKKFTNIAQDTKRDSFLFGENLGEKIKASKTTEKSGLQIKRTFDAPSTSSSYRPNRSNTRQQGNLRGPPKHQTQRGKPGGPRPQTSTQAASRRPAAPAAERYSSRTNYKTNRKTH